MTSTVTTSENHDPGSTGRPTPIGRAELGVAAAVALALYAIGIGTIGAVPDGNPVTAGLVQYAVSGLAPLGGFLAAVAYRIRDVRPFGIRKVSWKWIGIAVAVGLGVIALNLTLTALLVTYGGLDANVQADYQSAATGGPLAFAGAIVLGAMLTPLGEELLFRGVLTNFLGRYGAWVAVLGSALIFAIAHGINYVMPVAFLVGVLSALLLRRTGSIWPCVVVHLCNNANSVILPALMSRPAARRGRCRNPTQTPQRRPTRTRGTIKAPDPGRGREPFATCVRKRT